MSCSRRQTPQLAVQTLRSHWRVYDCVNLERPLTRKVLDITFSVCCEQKEEMNVFCLGQMHPLPVRLLTGVLLYLPPLLSTSSLYPSCWLRSELHLCRAQGTASLSVGKSL